MPLLDALADISQVAFPKLRCLDASMDGFPPALKRTLVGRVSFEAILGGEVAGSENFRADGMILAVSRHICRAAFVGISVAGDHAGFGGGLRFRIAARIRPKTERVTVTSASWKVILRAWRTTRAPILIRRLWMLVSAV